MAEIYRNPNGNFEIVTPLIDVSSDDDEYLSGKASELDSNTIIIYYHNATVWTAATFSGTPVELGSTGVYSIQILSSFFTARDESYPIFIKIVDDAGTKTWKDTGIIIQSNMKMEKLEVSRSDSNPAVKFNNGSSGNAFDLNSSTGYGIRVTSGSKALSLESINNEGLNITSTNGKAVQITASADQGINVTSYSECIELSSSNSLTGLKAQRVYLTGASGLSTLHIIGSGSAPAVSITHSTDKGVFISAATTGLEVITTGGAAVKFTANNDTGLLVSGLTGATISGTSFQGLVITSNNTNDAVQFYNSGTGRALRILSSSPDETWLVQNSGNGHATKMDCTVASAFQMRSTGDKDIDAAEITDILTDTNEIQGKVPAVGPIASQADVQSLSNNTRYRISVPTFAKIPDSSFIMVPVSIYFLDDDGLPYDPDDSEVALQIRAVNQQAYKTTLYDDEAGTTPASLNSTFSPSYYDVIKITTGEYMSYLKIASTETVDTWSLKFKFEESTNEITLPSQISILDEVSVITLDDSSTNRQIIAKSLKVEEIPDAEVSGSIYKDLKDGIDSTVAKLPATGTISNYSMSTTVDGRTMEYINKLILAMFTGKYVKDSPVDGQLTIMEQDNTTPLAIMAITETQRTRISPV